MRLWRLVVDVMPSGIWQMQWDWCSPPLQGTKERLRVRLRRSVVGLGLSGESHLEQSRLPVLYRDQKGFLSVSVKKDQIATLERDKTSPLENSQSPL